MQGTRAFAIVIAAITLATGFTDPSTLQDDEPTNLVATRAAEADPTHPLRSVPVAFVPNLGQWQHPAAYVAKFGAMTAFLEQTGWTFTLAERGREQTAVAPTAGARLASGTEARRVVAGRMTFVGASVPTLEPEHRLPGCHNYFLGNDPARWRSDVPLYDSVVYRQIHAGVDVRVRSQDSRMEFDLILAPDAKLETVEIAVAGIVRMHLGSDGALILETALGALTLPVPTTWEEGPSGATSSVPCRYVLRGDHSFGFAVSARQPGFGLTVDPGLVWSTYLGGVDAERPFALAVDAQGATTVVGETYSADYPTTLGAFDRAIGLYFSDAFVTRLSPHGSHLVYSTFLGGLRSEAAKAVALDAQGGAVVAGTTSSIEFPTVAGSFDTTFNGGVNTSDGFITHLSPTGSSLVYSTFLGGFLEDSPTGIALDPQGAATVAGYTYSQDLPTTPGAVGRNLVGWVDGFVTKLSADGTRLIYSTFLGGSSSDLLVALALDAQGGAVVVGNTLSADFPTTPGAFATTNSGTQDVFVSRLSPTGTSLVYSTYLGGNSVDDVAAVVVDARGAATLSGQTQSPNFPTTAGAYDRTYGGSSGDGFVTRLAPNGARLEFSTFLGGSRYEMVAAIALDAQGAITVAGFTDSLDFPTTPGALATQYRGGAADGFVARLSSDAAALVYSTFLGGAAEDRLVALALDAGATATVLGHTASSDFPTTVGSFDRSYNGGQLGDDAIVTRLDLLPTGVVAFGRSSPGCSGLLPISVTSMPRPGNAGFAVTCGNARPFTLGVCELTAQRRATPLTVLGVELWLDPSPVFYPCLAFSNGIGACEIALPIPQDPRLVGGRFFAQFLWVDSTSPSPCPPLGWAASNALEITVQR